MTHSFSHLRPAAVFVNWECVPAPRFCQVCKHLPGKAEPQDSLGLQGLKKVRGFWPHIDEIWSWPEDLVQLADQGVGNWAAQVWASHRRGIASKSCIGSDVGGDNLPSFRQTVLTGLSLIFQASSRAAFTPLHCTSLVGKLETGSWKQLEKGCLCSESHTGQYEINSLD